MLSNSRLNTSLPTMISRAELVDRRASAGHALVDLVADDARGLRGRAEDAEKHIKYDRRLIPAAVRKDPLPIINNLLESAVLSAPVELTQR